MYLYYFKKCVAFRNLNFWILGEYLRICICGKSFMSSSSIIHRTIFAINIGNIFNITIAQIFWELFISTFRE